MNNEFSRMFNDQQPGVPIFVRRFMTGLITGACICMAMPGFAQSGGEQTLNTGFEEIIVTAQKREQSIYEVPAAISAFSGDLAEKKGITDLIDVGKFVPNLNVTNFSAGSTSSANPFIRGIGLQDHLITTDPGVGVYVDGVYLGRQIGQNWSLADLERLEILRGPQGTLYGRNSVGGAINIITRKPDAGNIARIALQAGNRNRINASYYGSYKVDEQLAISGSLATKQRDGIGDFLNLDTSTKVGETQDVSGRLSVLWQPAENLSLLFTADSAEVEGGLNPYTTIILPGGSLARDPADPNGGAGLTNADISADRFDNNTGQADLADIENSAYGFSVTADYGISDHLSAKIIASRRSSDYEAGLDDDSALINFLQFGEFGEADQTSFELQLNGDYGRFDFVSGLYYFYEDGMNDQPAYTFNGGAGSEQLEQELTSYAVYGNLGYAVSDALRISGGLRYTRDDKEADVAINNFIRVSAQEDFSELSWDASATYEIRDRLTLFGIIANGYQSGQFNPRPFCLFGFLNPSPPAPPGSVRTPNCFDQDLDNITAINYEVGIKGEPFDRLQMSLSVFYTDYEDLPYQVSTTEGAGFNTVNLIVDQTSKGVEWESSLRVFDGFYLNASFGYIDVDVDAPNAEAPLTPEFTASISPEYSFALGGGTMRLRADYSYRDEMFGEPSSDRGRMTRINSRALVNFDASYLSNDGTWSLSLYGRNITDKRYENARLNTGDYILAILSNDPSEFGLRFTKEF